MIEFGEWLPDLAAQNNPGATEAKNVIPVIDGYAPLPSFGATSENGLDRICRGATSIFSDSGVAYNYAGDRYELYVKRQRHWVNASSLSDKRYEPTPGTLTLTGVAATVTFSSQLYDALSMAELVLTGQSATVGITVSSPEFEATPGSLVLASANPTLLITGPLSLTALPGTITLEGKKATVAFSEFAFYDQDVDVYGDYWEFAKWGNKLIAIGGIQVVPQIVTLGNTNFGNLTVSPPNPRHISVVRNFVVLGNLSENGITYPSRVRWSGINDETEWTTNPRAQSDFQDLQGYGGWIRGIRGGEYGVIFQENSIWRMDYIGPPIVFAFDETQPGVGTSAPNSIVQWGDTIFFLSQTGFMVITQGREVKSIDANKISEWFYDNLSSRDVSRVVGALDHVNRRVVWVFPGTDSGSGLPTAGVIYDIDSGRWSRFEKQTEWIYSALGEGYTLEGLDDVSSSIDALALSLDSKAWMGGTLLMSAFDINHFSNEFSGQAMTGVVETKEQQIVSAKRAFVSRVRPEVDGANMITVSPGTRDVQTEEVSFGAESSAERDGGHAMRSEARYHRFRVNITGGFTKAQGIRIVEAVASSKY